MQLEMTAIRSPSCAVVPIGIAVRVAKAKRLGHHLTAAESKRRPCLEFSSGKGAGTQTAEGKPIARTASCGPEPFPLAQSLPRNTFKWYNNLWHYIMMCFETKNRRLTKVSLGILCIKYNDLVQECWQCWFENPCKLHYKTNPAPGSQATYQHHGVNRTFPRGR